MPDQDRRLHERARDALRYSRSGRIVLLTAVAAIVVANTLIDVAASYFLIQDDFHTFRVWSALSMGLTALINLILVVLMWVVFDTLTRVEREADRTQMFMDTMYRRGP